MKGVAMNQNVLNTDLNGKVAVVTGAGGVLCSYFAKVLAKSVKVVYNIYCLMCDEAGGG